MERPYVVLATFCVVLLYCAPVHANSTPATGDPCPGQGRISTGQGQDAGFPVGSKICPNDGGQQQLYGGCETNPYPYLEQRHTGDRSNSFVTPRGGSQSGAQQGLNPGLACRLMRFMEFAEQRGCRLTINSAMRPVQRCNPTGGACAPQGSSCHQYGLAVDVGGTPQCMQWVLSTLGRQNANSPFGLHSAYAENGNYRHLQCVENLRAGCSAQTQGCGNTFRVNENALRNISGPGAPSSELSKQARQALGMPTQPPQQQQPPPPPQPAVPSYGPAAQATPAAQTLPQPTQSQFCLPEYRCSGNQLVYQNSFCATQVQQVCAAGCSNGMCVGSAASSSTNSNANTNDPFAQGASSSAIDIIGRIGGLEATTTSIGTSTPLQLILALSEDQSGTVARPTSSPVIFTTASGSISSVQPMYSQQTFTSPNLNQGYRSVVQQNRSQLFTVLENMRHVLIRALEYLRPFRFNQERAANAHDQHE